MLNGVELNLARDLIHERLDGKHVRIGPESSGGRSANRHLGDEIRGHLVAFEFVKSNGIAVGRVVGGAAIFRDHQIKRLFQETCRQQIARVSIGPDLMGVRPQSQVPIQNFSTLAQARVGFDHHGRTVGLPLVFLGSGVLHSHR